MENNGMRTEEEKREMAEQIAQAATRAIHEETQEEKSAEVEQQQGEKEEEKASRFSLTREQIGTMATKVKDFINRNFKVIIAGGLVVISASLLTMSLNNKNQAEGNNTTSITDQNNDIDEEKNEIVITPAETTTPVSTTTSEPEEIIVTTPVSTTTSEPEEIIVTTPVSTTTSEPEEIIVTKPVSTTTSEPEEIIVTKPVSTTTSKPEEIKVEKPVSTTTKVKEEQEPVVIEKPEPIIVSNLEQKEDDLIIALESVGIYVSDDELISNTIRVLNSDYIEHDGLGEITAVEYSQVTDLLSSYGSVNNVTFSAGYMGYIPEITEGVYLPTSILPKSGKKFQEEFIKLSESYRLELNKATKIVNIELTAEEDIQIQEAVMKELDKLNISDGNLYEQKFSELYTEKWTEIYNKKLEQNQKEHDKEVSKIYKDFYKEIINLVNRDEYEKLTPAEKLAVFTNISGAMTSGIQEKNIDKYMNFHKGIESSADQVREDLIVANTLNISQQEALDKIVENKEFVKQERQDLKDLDPLLEELYENKELLIKGN